MIAREREHVRGALADGWGEHGRDVRWWHNHQLQIVEETTLGLEGKI
jgi:hypothetical protein